MSSYAEVAALSGPTDVAEKIPEPAKLQETFTSTDNSKISSVPKEEFEKLKQEAEKIEDEVSKEFPELEKKVEKKEKELLEELKKFTKSVSEKVLSALASLSSSTVEVSQKTQKELENPVVVAQVAAGVGAIAAGYAVFLERNKIKTENPVILGLQGAAIAGLVGLDIYLFNKYYPKYKK